LKFSGIGFSFTLVGLILLNAAWRGRIRSVRRSVIRAQTRGEQ